MQGQIKGKQDQIVFQEIDVTRDSKAPGKYGIKLQIIPTLIVLDPEGNQVKVFVGVPRESELKAAISQAISP